jgi:hypothetical protein
LEKTLIDDFFMIHQGPKEQPSKGAKGGVAIILSQRCHTSGGQVEKTEKIARGGISIGDTTRILSLSIKFKLQINESSKLSKELAHTLV